MEQFLSREEGSSNFPLSLISIHHERKWRVSGRRAVSGVTAGKGVGVPVFIFSESPTASLTEQNKYERRPDGKIGKYLYWPKTVFFFFF